MSLNSAIFFLSTGRCGTQWLTNTLSEVYPDSAVVTHEPVRGFYKRQQTFRNYDYVDDSCFPDEVLKHLEWIEETLKEKTYIETGWPCYSAIPWLIRKLEGRIKLVHLVRHPVEVAISLATHKVYSRADWISADAIGPLDAGIHQTEISTKWPHLSMYEKCLFLWTEVNLYALELKEKYPNIPYYFIRSEDMFSDASNQLQDLLTFMGLPYNEEVDQRKRSKFDVYKMKTKSVNWKLINQYPKAIELSKVFDYTLDNLQTQRIKERYIYSKKELINLIIHKISINYKKLTS